MQTSPGIAGVDVAKAELVIALLTSPSDVSPPLWRIRCYGPHQCHPQQC